MYEIILAGGCLTSLSCLYQAHERVELEALRSVVFIVLNVVLPYVGVLMQQDIDTYVNICRTLIFLLAEPEQALAWLAIYFLSIGYQLRGVKHQRPVVEVVVEEEVVKSSDESVLLREALAFRKGFGGPASV